MTDEEVPVATLLWWRARTTNTRESDHMSEAIKVTIEQATVADFRRIETRTGRPMVRFRAEVGKDRLAVIAFNDLAEHLDLADGDTVNVIGRLQGTSWEGQDGGRRYGWQVIGEQVEQAVQSDRLPPPPPAPPRAPTAHTPPAKQGRQVRMFSGAAPGPFVYDGGPF